MIGDRTGEKSEACPEESPPWTETRNSMQNSYQCLRTAVGCSKFDREFKHIKGYMEGYLDGIEFMARELDL